MNKEQLLAALKVLKNMQTCVLARDTFIPGKGDVWNQDAGYVSPFNLTKSFGICWHVYAHTKGDLSIDTDFLKPVFVELGYNDVCPVESAIDPEGNPDTWYNARSHYDLYFGEDAQADERRKLLDKLVQYFENKLYN